MSEARYLVTVPGGGQGGPYTAEQVQSFVANNQIPPGAQVIDIMASSPVAPPPGSAGPITATPEQVAASPAQEQFHQAPDMADDFEEILEVAPAPVPLNASAPYPASAPSATTHAHTTSHHRRPQTSRIKGGKRSGKQGGRRNKTGRIKKTDTHRELAGPVSTRHSKTSKTHEEQESSSSIPMVPVIIAAVAVLVIIVGIFAYSQSDDNNLHFETLEGRWHINIDRLDDHAWFRQAPERERERLRTAFSQETFSFAPPNTVMAFTHAQPRWQRAEMKSDQPRPGVLVMGITPYDKDEPRPSERWQISSDKETLSLLRDGRAVTLAKGPAPAFTQAATTAHDETDESSTPAGDASQDLSQDTSRDDPEDHSSPETTELPAPSPTRPGSIQPEEQSATKAFETLSGSWRIDPVKFFDTNYYINTNNSIREDQGLAAARHHWSRLFATTFVFSENQLEEKIGPRSVSSEHAISAVRLPGSGLPAWQVTVENEQGERRDLVLRITGDNAMLFQMTAGRGMELTLMRGAAPQEEVDIYLELEE